MRSAAANTIFFMEFPLFKYLMSDASINWPSARQSAGPMHILKNLPAARRRAGKRCNQSLRRGLGVHIDDLDATVDRVHRRVRVLRFGLAIADGDEIAASDAVFRGEVAL